MPFVYIFGIHTFLSFLNKIILKIYTEARQAICRGEVHSYSQKQFHHEESSSFLSIRPFRMQIKIYWLAFLFHIRVSFYRAILEKNVEPFYYSFYFLLFLFQCAPSLVSYYLSTVNFGRSLVEADNWLIKIFCTHS